LFKDSFFERRAISFQFLSSTLPLRTCRDFFLLLVQFLLNCLFESGAGVHRSECHALSSSPTYLRTPGSFHLPEVVLTKKCSVPSIPLGEMALVKTWQCPAISPPPVLARTLTSCSTFPPGQMIIIFQAHPPDYIKLSNIGSPWDDVI